VTARPLIVVGDVMLDVDIEGEVSRLSPEAPVPVVAQARETLRAGGAALAALLASRWHEDVVLLAPDAGDEAARDVRAQLGDRVRWIGLPWQGSTPVKTRLRGSGQPIARLDRGGAPGAVGDLPVEAHEALQCAGAVLVADYGVGATGAEPVRAALERCAAPIVWDPHPRGAAPVVGVRLATPNRAEAAGFAGAEAGGAGSLRPAEDHGRALRERWGTSTIAVTLGAEGALLVQADGISVIPAVAGGQVDDTCGAGDCFAAAAAVALAHGAVPSDAVAAGVRAATDFVRAGAASGLAAWLDGPGEAPAFEVDGAASAAEVIERARAAGRRVVATGGCFDLLHAGHVETLRAARALGDCLVVLLNSDDSVRRLKGPGRPLQPAPDRAAVLRALRVVDAVEVFDEDTPMDVLSRLRPDVWVKGGDYSDAQLPEAGLVRSWGGQVITLPFLPGRSTTQIVARARSGAGT
jgi:D-beta-D-heptose 7-phosphate kinase/D-beta-D-heptose 1-phosphate adenosyltransferase